MTEDLRDVGRLQRPDGRVVAWAEYGPPDGFPLLLIPGTPGSRLSYGADRAAWDERGLRVIVTERPGFGSSSPLPNRGFIEHADDLDAILDHLGVGPVALYGQSGGGPHVLALLSHHPDRVRAATISVGVAPLIDEEADQLIGLNATMNECVRTNDFARYHALLETTRAAFLADPLAGMQSIMHTAPPADHAVMSDPAWQNAFSVGIREALQPGIDGWAAEWVAFCRRWDEIDVSSITTSLTWWHGDGDRNCPLSAAKRLTDEIPSATFPQWTEAGHLTPHHKKSEILDELMDRCSPNRSLRIDGPAR